MKKSQGKIKMIYFILWLMYAVVIGVHVFFPKSALNIWLSSQILFAQFYAFPIFFGGVIALVSVSMLLISGLIFKRKVIHRSGFQFWIGILIISLVFALGATDFKTQTEYSEAKDTFRIVVWNTLNNMNERYVDIIFKEYGADLAVFPELGGYSVGDKSHQRLRDLFSKTDVDINQYEVFVSPDIIGGSTPVTIVVKKSFANYTPIQEPQMTTLGTLYLESPNDEIPDIVGLHTIPPLPQLMSSWNWDLRLIADQIVPKYSQAIIMGDFNATTRHGAMNKIDSHQDVLTYLPFYQRGTWNLDLPTYLRTSIDHILLPKDQYGVTSIEMKDFPESDHACIFVELYRK